jgi:putative ABC transport system permease protein
MIANIILVAVRNLNRYRFYTLVNLTGLTFAMTLFLVIMLYVRFELSFDKFNEKADRIYRVDWNLKFGENSAHNAALTSPMAEAIARDFPEVESATRLYYIGGFHFRKEDQNVVEWRVVYADNSLFKIFTIPFLSGDPATALNEPNSIVLSESSAKQFFPDEDALGKTLLQDDKTLLKITGVVRDLPVNSHFHYRMFISLESLEESRNGNWIGSPFNTYVLLRKDADAPALEGKLSSIVNNYVLPNAASQLGKAFMDDFTKGGNSLTLEMRPLLDIHLYSHLRNELEGNSDIKHVHLLTAVAMIVLALACVNFVNLSTARSVKRAREVGIRKVLGSDRSKLIAQFFAESIAVSVTASFCAAGFTHLMLPVFNAITGLDLYLSVADSGFWFIVLATGLAIGFLSGAYPALVLSSYKPVKVLKGTFIPRSGSMSLRSALVVFQFTLSITLIIATLALEKQMHFLQNREMGFDKEQVVLVHDVGNLAGKLPAISQEVLRDDIFIQSTVSSYFPGPGSARKTPLLWQHGSEPSAASSVNMEMWTVDYDYVPALGIKIVEGRNFSRDFPSDSSAVLLNETAVKLFGFNGDAIGQKINAYAENPDGSQSTNILTWTVVGVVRDFNYESLREQVEPLGLFFGSTSSFIAFRYKTAETTAAIQKLQAVWKRLAPGESFYYSFLDDKFNTFYRTDQKIRDIFWVFSILAIVIAGLGLFALTAFAAEQKTKEIGIRKVLGATTNDILVLLSMKFTQLIIIAFILAVPLGLLCIDWYLRQFTYRTNMGTAIFVYAGVGALSVALITMLYHALRAAHNNPADALKAD